MSGLRVTIDGVWNDSEFPMSHAVVEPEGKRVHLTGQVAWTENFEVISPDDAGKQTHAAIDNIERVLANLGGTIEDVVSTTMYYVRDEDLDAIQEARRTRFSFNAGPAVTGVKVAALVDDALLVELTVVAVIPHEKFRSPSTRSA
ncbi:RidA family protein [Mesorhizobium ventifaucium]|uniref:Endoribonuclease-like protein n=1 Tax=Mesorhizobium ventifaucium TaxID=666020 RepID=A0ABM9DJD3_9HYPH|nr:RidA family protein [Mesorhizobium ventifaucium]CAH2396704.1 Endoribonuclease-like protein [Mesorhizobium ventifaucium]